MPTSQLLSMVTLISLLMNSLVFADPSLQDKRGYHLFNPTLRALMRPLSADRPDTTESPITVDAGHAQIELSVLSYTHDDDAGQEVNTWSVFDTNLKIGLLNNVDLQIVTNAYSRERTDPDVDSTETLEGFGDVQIRTKVNLWGNDGGKTAFGIMPFVKIPTGTELSNDRVEGGLIAMFGWDVAERWGLGFMAEVDVVYDAADDDYDTEFVHTAVLGLDVVGPLGAYVEYAGVVSSDTDMDYQAIFSVGLTLALTENLVLDAGTQIGLTSAADDVTVFTGVTIRF